MDDPDDDQLEWRDTYFILFQQSSRPTLTQVEAAIGNATRRVTLENLEADDDGMFESLLVQAPDDHAALEISYETGDAVIEQSADLQERLLLRAADWVKLGGSLVYAVCSLEPREGEDRIEAFLAERSDYQLQPAPILADGVTPHAKGWVRVLPGMLAEEGGLDGFFTAHLVRSA